MTQIQPADFETADYRTVLRRLTTLDDEAAAMRAEASRWHDSRLEAADEAVRDADRQVAEAKRAVAQAQRAAEQVDARAAQIWSQYVHKVGPVAERFGKTPPQPAIPHQRGEREPDDYLDEVAAKVEYTPKARPINVGVKALFALFGVVGGLVGAAANEALRQLGSGRTDSWQDALPVVALVVLLACPVLAVVATKRVADHRGVGLDAATVALVLIAGLVTAGVVIAAVRSTG
jgi:hypothetical protein